ncbi:DUF1194 domain-containing protein [Mesorhizobium sp. BR1-1-2]|uniref:DUF1194 domain-containing protein n=1 Tax=Mesorhizobium sp. BR1-1-2 TaxID=2876652 RepID=UPI001CC9CA81|nr:DUF1194 domain-containing protein [Mesorhizobium sp. BR1-1-2]MBZ9965904.1 DUF1194 domain-containing protein [Mesorhizobium sp. BR1-1-2]
MNPLGRLTIPVASALLALPAYAADVDAAIVFAVDMSSSVDAATADMLREGHASAMYAPEVMAAITRNRIGCVGITYFEWASRGHLHMVLPWTRVCGLSDGKAAASAILERAQRGYGHTGGDTSISFAIDEGSLLLEHFPGAAARKIIDIAGNGTNNDGLPVQQSRLRAISKGFTINAIVISPLIRSVKYDLTSYFAENVIGGPSAFVIAPANKSNYAVALRRKLVDEIGLSIDKQDVAGLAVAE